MLFYVRKDLQSKSLTDLLPNIETDFFCGKPVKLNGKDGFVLENPTKDSQRTLKIKIKNTEGPQTVS